MINSWFGSQSLLLTLFSLASAGEFNYCLRTCLTGTQGGTRRRIKRILLAGCFFGFFPVWLNAQVSQDWIAVSPGPHVEINYEPKPNSRSLNVNKLATNNQNNLFTVETYYDTTALKNIFLFIKYNSYGEEIWTKQNANLGGGILLNDDFEFIYVASTDYNFDYVLLKFNTDGDSVWSKSYNGPANSYDFIADMTKYENNIYVTGTSYGDTTSADYLTIKYNSSGDTLWTARYNSPTNDYDYGYFIDIDDSGNVIITGVTNENAGDYITVKYDSNGNELWVARYDGPVSSTDIPVGVGVDGDGNIYVSGQSNTTTGGGAGTDYRTIKYSPGGTELWVSTYNGPADSEDVPYDMTVDSSGNVYVTGRAKGGGGDMEFATVKYDSSGAQKWVALYDPANGEDYAKAIVLDDSGNVYVFGNAYMDAVDNYDFVTIKYDSTGAEQWTAIYSRPGGYEEIAWSMVVDDNYNVYITGYSRIPGDTVYDIITIKYCQFGTTAGFIADTLSITAGDTLNFTNTSTNTTWWSWDFGDGAMDTSNYDAAHVYDSAGTYTVTLIVWNSCGADTVSQTLTVTCQQVVSAFSYSDSLLIVSFANSSTNATGWVWDFGDGDTGSVQDPVHTYDSAGVYNVCLFASNGCSTDTFCQSINIVGVGIQDHEVTRGIGVYPNPNDGRFTVTIASRSRSEIFIYNVLGEIIYHSTLLSSEFVLDLSSKPRGIYYIKVLSDGEVFVEKIIRQ